MRSFDEVGRNHRLNLTHHQAHQQLTYLDLLVIEFFVGFFGLIIRDLVKKGGIDQRLNFCLFSMI